MESYTMKTIIIFLILLSVLLQASDFHDIIKKEKTEQKIALIIGNSKYTNLPHLKNPLNDARLIRDTFKKKGFTILYKENANIREMKKLLRKFAYKIRQGGVGFYYFAGQSVNVDGKNYQVGIDASLDNKVYISHEAIPLNNIIKKMRSAGNRLNVIISDTCRNTIAITSYGNHHFDRGVGRGLNPLSNTEGIFIAFTTAADEMARDGKESSNGILTKYFVKNLTKGSANLKEVFTNIEKDVYTHTDAKKNSVAYNQIMNDYFFILPPLKHKKQ